MSLICAYTGYTYAELRELPYIYYNDLLGEVGLKLQYMSVVNAMGRDYSDDKLCEIVDSMNPINIDQTDKNAKTKEVKERLTFTKLKEVGLI